MDTESMFVLANVPQGVLEGRETHGGKMGEQCPPTLKSLQCRFDQNSRNGSTAAAREEVGSLLLSSKQRRLAARAIGCEV